MHWPFQIGRLYSRRSDIHAPYRGQQQGGIITPVKQPGVFCVTGSGAKRIGYHDRELADGSFRYTGEGQVGDMKMRAGNKAVLEHARNGKDLLLFHQPATGKPIRFMGLYVCDSWELEQQPDRNNNMRSAIVFRLVPLIEIESALDGEEDIVPTTAVPLGELRERAVAASVLSSEPAKSAATVYHRSKAVRDYVLARADGTCEGCHAPAPFVTPSKRPYLEPHHIRRLSDGGPDHPAFVAAVCPNCHRRAHHAADAKIFNADLLARVAAMESAHATALT